MSRESAIPSENSESSRGKKMRTFWSRSERSRQAWLTLLVILVIWEACVHFIGIRDFLLPAPTKIWEQFLAQPGYLLLQSLDTLRTTLYGFTLALVLGVAAAIGIVYSKFLDRSLYSLLVAL